MPTVEFLRPQPSPSEKDVSHASRENVRRRLKKSLRKDHKTTPAYSEVPIKYLLWSEYAPNLTDGQRLAANVVSTKTFLQICLEDAHNQLPWLRNKREYNGQDGEGRTQDNHIIAQHIEGLLAAQAVSHLSDLEKQRSLAHFGDRSDYYNGRFERFISPREKVAKNKIYYQAKFWEPSDQRRVMLSAVKSIKRKLRDQIDYLLEDNAGLTNDLLKEARNEWMKTIAISAGSEGLSLTAGILANKFNVLDLFPKNMAEFVTWGTYAPLAYMIFQSFRIENLKLLKQKGISMVPFSKIGRYISEQLTDHEPTHDLVTNGCYTAEQLGREVPFLALLILGGAANFTNANVVSLFVTGAKIGGSRLMRSRKPKDITYRNEPQTENTTQIPII